MPHEDALAELTLRFYEIADADPLLGPVIRAAIPTEKRGEHFATFRDFWSGMLLGSERYSGNAFAAHANLTLEPAHFQRWLEIFAQVAADILPPETAERALAQARHMSECLQGKSSHHHGDNQVAWPLGRAAKSGRRLPTAGGGGCGCGSH